MIEGLKIEFTTEQLKDHFQQRINHHTERASFYEKQANALAEGDVEQHSYTGGDPIKSLKDSLKSHKNRAALFIIMRDHLILNEVYRLNEQDLARLEIMDRYF